MDYKERYEKTLEGIREILSSGQDSIKMSRLQLRLQCLFPELKESEDERVRKDLINTIKLAYDCGVAITIETRDEYLAWLEKQGEQKPVDKIEPKQDWSEEDEIFVNGLIRGLSAKRDIHGHTTFSSDCIDITETINWLKSLKDRYTWKPSDE